MLRQHRFQLSALFILKCFQAMLYHNLLHIMYGYCLLYTSDAADE